MYFNRWFWWNLAPVEQTMASPAQTPTIFTPVNPTERHLGSDFSFILPRYWKSLVLALLKRSRIEGWVFNHLCHNNLLWLSTNCRTFDVKKIDGVSSLAALENGNFIFLILNSSVIMLARSWKTYKVSSNRKSKQRQHFNCLLATIKVALLVDWLTSFESRHW
jgi:hypothetical protein